MPVVVLISGNGSNLQAIIDAIDNQQLPIDIAAVISNRPDAYGLERAAAASITTAVVDHREYPRREDFDKALMGLIDKFEPQLVVLAGFMRILTAEFVEHYRNRLLNIHPALLPAFPGLNTHERALQAGVQQHGSSVHFVTTEVDGGPLILQARVEVRADDTAAILAARVLKQEHIILPMAIKWFAEKRLHCQDNTVLLDNKELPASGLDLDSLS